MAATAARTSGAGLAAEQRHGLQLAQRVRALHPRRQLNQRLRRVDDLQATLGRLARHAVEQRGLACRSLAVRLGRLRPRDVLARRRESLTQLTRRLRESLRQQVRALRERRKAAVARVRLVPGSGAVTVNKRPIDEYFPSATHRMIITEPLRLVEKAEEYDVLCTLDGGGISGQAGALRLGIARALAELDPEVRIPLKRAGFLTRDAREKESKKYGLKKARKAPQYSKR